MRYGVIFPQIEFGNDPAAIKDYAQTAESLGYDYLLIYDHVVGAHPDRNPKLIGPYTHENPFHEPLVFFGFLAAVTRRIEFATGILILPQRQTVLVAKQAAEVDILSGGRLRLGVAVGWNYVEYDSLGENFHTRGRRIETQVDLLRKLWTQPLLNYRNDPVRIENAGLNPLPIQQPIPIWFGGNAEPALKRAGRLGDGWISSGRLEPDAFRKQVELLHQAVRESGRDPAKFGIESRTGVSGTPEDWRGNVERLRSLGVTHLAVDTMRAGFQSPKDHIAAIQRFRTVLQP